jgi:type IV pilus assembly protein PilE
MHRALGKPSSRKVHGRAADGFTVVELVITAAIVAILAVVALKSYQTSERKANRAAAEAFLATVAQQEQQYFLDNRAYAACTSVTVAACPALGLATPSNVSSFYSVSTTASAGPPPSFTASAAPVTGTYQTKDTAGTLSIDNAGTKLPSGVW